jgi:hypothetical protein
MGRPEQSRRTVERPASHKIHWGNEIASPDRLDISAPFLGSGLAAIEVETGRIVAGVKNTLRFTFD